MCFQQKYRLLHFLHQSELRCSPEVLDELPGSRPPVPCPTVPGRTGSSDGGNEGYQACNRTSGALRFPERLASSPHDYDLQIKNHRTLRTDSFPSATRSPCGGRDVALDRHWTAQPEVMDRPSCPRRTCDWQRWFLRSKRSTRCRIRSA